MFGWGGLTTIASPILAIRLLSQDLMDTANGYEAITTSGVEGIKHFWDNLPVKAQRNIQMKTAAVNTMAYTMDNYADYKNCISLKKYGKPGLNGLYSQTFGGALTAITWGTVPWNPSTAGGSTGASNPPPGKYAILGAYVGKLTNYALIRFQHANFGGLYPGFPVMDQTLATARATVGLDDIFQQQGYQFAFMSDLYQVPCCPVFNITAQGTGLTIWCADITADTPIVNLNVTKIG